MGSATKKARYRDLFGEHFEISRKETGRWKGKVESRFEKEKRAGKKFSEVAEFVEVNMETAIRISYDHTKTMDANLKEYQDQKARQDESD